MRRGEVRWGLLEPRSGSEQKGHRPVVVVSHDGFNKAEIWRSVIVVPLSTSQRQHGPTVVALSASKTGEASSVVQASWGALRLDPARVHEILSDEDGLLDA